MFSIIYTFEFQPGKLIFFAWNTRCFWSGKNCAKQNSMELSMNLQFWHFSKRIIALIFWIFPRILTPKFDPYASSCLKIYSVLKSDFDKKHPTYYTVPHHVVKGLSWWARNFKTILCYDVWRMSRSSFYYFLLQIIHYMTPYSLFLNSRSNI